MLKRHSQGSRYVRFSPSCVVVLVVENLFLLSSRPPQSVCSLRLGASSPLSECQAFQHIWQCSFSLRIQAGDIKCRRHTLTMSTFFIPGTPQWFPCEETQGLPPLLAGKHPDSIRSLSSDVSLCPKSGVQWAQHCCKCLVLGQGLQPSDGWRLLSSRSWP